jgi:hypothetical protein
VVAAGCDAGIRHGERLDHSGRALQPRCRGFFLVRSVAFSRFQEA